MDPYLEGELFQEFHERPAGAIRSQLMEQLRPKYVALLAKRDGLPLEYGTSLTSDHARRLKSRAIGSEARLRGLRHAEDSPPLIAAGNGVEPAVLEEAPLLSVEIRSRTQRRPNPQIWPVQLHGRLPRVPVPLLAPDPDVVLDFQRAVDACLALVGYDLLLDYTKPPPPPELSAEALAWVRERVRHWQEQSGGSGATPPEK
jgi:hypothetical protein